MSCDQIGHTSKQHLPKLEVGVRSPVGHLSSWLRFGQATLNSLQQGAAAGVRKAHIL